MNKKGQVGMETAKAVMLTLMILAVFAFVGIILWSSLANTSVAKTSGSGFTNAETLTTVTETGESLAANVRTDAVCTVVSAINATSSTAIPATNYSVSGCLVSFTSGNSQGFNNSNWVVNYTYTYNEYGDVEKNISGGTAGFFANTSTWFALLSVVVIILIIAIVIFAVRRFGGSGGSNL